MTIPTDPFQGLSLAGKFFCFPLLFALAWGTAGLSGYAAIIAEGDLIIYRVGDGTGVLITMANSVFMDEDTTAGVLVQSIAVPNTGLSAVTATGNSTIEGIISLSQDGSALILTDYRKDVGGSNPSAESPAITNRVIGTLSLSGESTTTTAIIDVGGSIRGATSVNRTSSFYVGTSVSLSYVASPSGASSSTQIDLRDTRQVDLSGNALRVEWCGCQHGPELWNAPRRHKCSDCRRAAESGQCGAWFRAF